jgi:glycosyltransferase involved in cell wall biosynthesis
MSDVPFSVLISTYRKDVPRELREALSSVFDQTVVPTEVVIVTDGPVPDALENTLIEYENRYPDRVRLVSLPTNQGLGAALRRGVKECSNDLVARMDADDIAVPSRFEKQIDYLLSHTNVDVLGGYVGEFEGDPSEILRVRSVPTTQESVRSLARFRSPTNHPTVMFRREAVIDAGNYRSLRLMQDYDLWMRMLSQEYVIDNLPEVLVKFRAGDDLYARRGGFDYARLELELQRDFLSYGAISLPVFLFNICTRVPLRLVPSSIRKLVYRLLLRD